MQTFLPYRDFAETARCLDRPRLGNQRLEAWWAIDVSIKVLDNQQPRYSNHPTRLMWENNLHSLCNYGIAICDEWRRRGYVDRMRDRFIDVRKRFKDNGPPSWMEWDGFFLAHKSNLLRKGRERLIEKGKADILNHYKALWPDVPEDLPYIWPSQNMHLLP